MVLYIEEVDKTPKSNRENNVINKDILQRLLIEGGHDLEKILEKAEAEAEAKAQELQVWGLTDRQNDVIMWIDAAGYPYYVKGLAIYHYAAVNQAAAK